MKKQNNASTVIIAIVASIAVVFIFVLYIIIDGHKFANSLENNNNNTNYEVKKDKRNKDEVIAELKEKCKKYEYKTIFRYAEDYVGKHAKFTGEVVQIMDDSYANSSRYVLRVNVTKDKYGYYDDTIYVVYEPLENSTRILEDDIIVVYGVLNGLETYTTVLGSEITIPRVNSEYIEIVD